MSSTSTVSLFLVLVLFACDVMTVGAGCGEKKARPVDAAQTVAKTDTPPPAKTAEPETPSAPRQLEGADALRACAEAADAMTQAKAALAKKDFRAAVSRSRRAVEALENVDPSAATGQGGFANAGAMADAAAELHAEAKAALEDFRDTVGVALLLNIKNKATLKPEQIEKTIRTTLMERVGKALESRGLKTTARELTPAEAQALHKGDRTAIQAMEESLGAAHVLLLSMNVDIEKTGKVLAAKLESVTGTLYETSSGRLVNRDDLGRAMQQSEDAAAALQAAINEHVSRYGHAIDEMFRTFGAAGDTTPKEETPIIDEN